MQDLVMEQAPVVKSTVKPISPFLKDRYRGEQLNYHFRNTPEDPHIAIVNSVDYASDSISVIYFSINNGMRYAHGVRHIEDPWNESHFEAAVENGTFSEIENPRMEKAIRDIASLNQRVRELESKLHLLSNLDSKTRGESVKKLAEAVGAKQ
jgi:hypothetical protein